ncbi:hypothetical protein ACWKSP_09170 [Micromonosporaceae bacterium Da 78-11]
MKFFSNEAKENTEDQAHDERDLDRTDSVQSDPVSVPQQRAGSPWNDAPGTADDTTAAADELSDQERRDREQRDLDQLDSVQLDSEPRDSDRLDSDRTDSDLDQRDELRADDSEVRTYGDEPVPSDTDTTTPPAHTDSVDLPLDDRADTDDNRDADVDNSHDFGDRPTTTEDTVTATTYGPDGTVKPADEQVDTDAQRVDADAPLKDDGDFDSPEAVEPATGEPLNADTDPEPATEADTAPVVAAVPVETEAKTPGSVEAPKLDRLFADGDSFADRFRDIQLRFVDSPKEATAEAATLVGEAVDQLTSALKAQKDGLSADSDDTEKLRVELRGYRDLLNRLTSL